MSLSKKPSSSSFIFGAIALVIFSLTATTQGCSVFEPNRKGTFIVEHSIRTTSDPNLLVALLGDYNQKDSDWESYEPQSTKEITIDYTTGDVYWGYPGAGVTINDPPNATVPGENFTVELDGSFATLTGSALAEPFVFPYTGQGQDEYGFLEDAFIYSDTFEKGYYFYNAKPQEQEGAVAQARIFGGDGIPTVTIIDLSDPDNISYTEFEYSSNKSPGYFNGPAVNVFDSIQVVELPESGADCFSSAYYYYNETTVRWVDFKLWTRDSFTLNAISDDGAYAYNVKNIIPDNPGPSMHVTPNAFKLERVNIATGERTEFFLNHVNNPLNMTTTIDDEPTVETSRTTTSSEETAPVVDPITKDTTTTTTTTTERTNAETSAAADTGRTILLGLVAVAGVCGLW